ncbi:hypothetical protein DWB61_16825 [Ancylomarina euxinus]|uniref:Uncharacterized protein n=1 Tax=Ancylomarina euxinus TaxID=2283627 RepID=A0A425XWU8_9BACT|nr:hypothetical protein [Ancylomarina euxinus]MCZ4696302.1 hypothetical protein [Ancylomarina euxinus]MUP16733.1 hypothetical protein [Ancylomarina euxinus]RRG19116.1 hypothetical protein DWB61_16825 [Ancylomarina euxinus]
MDQESVSRLEILENILEFYKVQPGMNKDGKLEKVEEYLLLMHALYCDSAEELDELDINDIDFLENLFDTFNGYLNAVGEEMDKIFDDHVIDLTLIPIFGFSIVLPIHSIEMIKVWNKAEQDYWQIEIELSHLEKLVESDLFFEKFLELIKVLMLRINAKLVIEVENLI